jgi:hypothetical protein
MFCKSCALRTWPLLLLLLPVIVEEGLLAVRVGWPEADVTPAVGLAALVGTAEGEGVVEMFFLGAMVGLVYRFVFVFVVRVSQVLVVRNGLWLKFEVDHLHTQAPAGSFPQI